MMRKWAKLFFLCVGFVMLSGALPAQEYFTGKLSDGQEVYYDRTENGVDVHTHQTVYKVMNGTHKTLYTITLLHEKQKSQCVIKIRSTLGIKEVIAKYDPKKFGLIFSDKGNTDTIFPYRVKYNYLISFTDSVRDFPILHRLKTDDNLTLDLDPLPKLRVKKHKELLFRLPGIEPSKQKGERDQLNVQLLQLRDSVNKSNAYYINWVSKVHAQLMQDAADIPVSKHSKGEEKKYNGPKKGGKYDGRGVLQDGEAVYEGSFSKGKFIEGNVSIKTDEGEYWGESNGKRDGIGWLKKENGAYSIGSFRNDTLDVGIQLVKEKNGETFYGSIKNGQRNGYGELRNANGALFYGEFSNGRFIKGYTKETDQFGYSTYSKIEKGVKVSVDVQQPKDFFDSVTQASTGKK